MGKVMKENIYKVTIWFTVILLLIFTPIGRGTVKIWSNLPVIPITFLVFLWLWRMSSGDIKFQKTAIDKNILIFLSLAAVSFIFSGYKHDSLYAMLRLFGYAGLYYVIVNNYNRKMLKYMFGVLICLSTGLSIYGLLQYFGFLGHQWWNPKNFLAATYVNHNHFAGYLELVMPMAIGVVVKLFQGTTAHSLRETQSSAKFRPLAGLALVSLVIMTIAFVLTQSRGAWISLVISLLVMNIIFIKRKILKKESLIILLSLIILVCVFLYMSDGLVSKRIESIKEITSGEASMSTRFAIWEGTINMIAHNPAVGTGIGTFVWAFPRYEPWALTHLIVHYAHNDYLHMAAEMGIFALPLMLLILIRIISSGLSKADPIVIGCAIGMLSLSLHGFVDFNFHIPANMILAAVYAAIIMKES